MSITYEQVQHAIELLLESQEKFTLQDVRATLGDRGSMSTISKYVQKWKNQHYISQKPLEKSMKPAPEMLMESVSSLWQNMSDASNQKLYEKEKEIAEIKSQSEEHIASLSEHLEKEKSFNSDQTKTIERLEENIRALETQLMIERQSNKTLTDDKEQLLCTFKELAQETENTTKSFKEELKSQYAEKIEGKNQEISLLKEQISDLMNLNEEQRVNFISLHDKLKEEIKELSIKKISASYLLETQQALKTIESTQNTFLAEQKRTFEQLRKQVQTYQWKSAWKAVQNYGHEKKNT